MTKKSVKKSPPKAKKSSKSTVRPFRVVWFSFGIFAFLLTVLTSGYIYTNRQNSSAVLAALSGPGPGSKAIDGNPCYKARLGNGGYCGGKFGTVGPNYMRYWC